jgi:hypothetical protein
MLVGSKRGIKMNSSSVTSAWNALFSSLAFAEKAAANECLKVAKRFRDDGLNDLADEYDGLAVEENRHHDLALSVAREIVPLTERASLIYAGGFFSKNGSVLERLMSVHFVFEPSALAFLGYISRHSHDLFEDRQWADQITKAFNQILRDEVHHVQDGGLMIKRFWSTATDKEKEVALKTMRRHRAFLKAGLLSFFSQVEIKKEVVFKMLERFDFYYEKSVKGVFDAEPAKAAS